jgi:hypothetical protein
MTEMVRQPLNKIHQACPEATRSEALFENSGVAELNRTGPVISSGFSSA